MKPLIQLEKEQLVIMRQQRDLLNEGIKTLEHHIKKKENETPDPVVPWEPKGGAYTALYSGAVSKHPVVSHTGRTFPTKEAAEQASKFFAFYQRYYSLAMEMNEKHKAEGKKNYYSVACDSGPWTTASIGSFGFIDQLFTSKAAAQAAADIMNRDRWMLPTL